MNIWLKNGILLIGLMATAAVLLMWAETEKEISVLCSMVNPGNRLSNTIATLETGNYLEFTISEKTTVQALEVSSPYNLWSSNCNVSFTDSDVVESVDYHEKISILTVASLTGSILSAVLALFQQLLAFGLPLGRFAWGGKHTVLPTRLKTASFVSSLVILFCAILFIEVGTEPQIFLGVDYFTPVLGLFTIVFAISTFANFNSSSPPERLTGTPIAFLLCMCSFVAVLF